MEKALDAYEQLKDASTYVLEDWLRLPISKDLSSQILYLNGASAFLFDRLFAKENAGMAISLAVKTDLMEVYVPETLSDLAAELLLRLKSFDPEKDPGDFSEYYRFIIQTEDYVPDGLRDDQGKLALIYIEKLVNLIMDANKDQSGLKVGEIVFLNLTDAWRLIYKGFFGPRFMSLQSFQYFEGVNEESERIRADINE